jgi:hypothetical protein
MATTRKPRERQIEFPPLQTHDKNFERAMIILAIVCVIVVLFIVLATGIGTEFRPKAGSRRPRAKAPALARGSIGAA